MYDLFQIVLVGGVLVIIGQNAMILRNQNQIISRLPPPD